MSTSGDIRSAFGLLTIAPLGRRQHDAPSVSTVAWAPLVGLALGVLPFASLAGLNAASVLWGDGAWLVRCAFPLAVLVVAAQALLTRLMHWDGLADVADAWWGGDTPKRRQEIMSDSATGAFGATALMLAGIGQAAALSAILSFPGLGVSILAVPVFGRLSIAFAAWLGSPAKPGGLGALVIGRPAAGSVMVAAGIAAFSAVPVVLEHGLLGAVWCGCALLVAAVVPHLISLRMGGVTGDVIGASVVITETLILLIAALAVTFS